MKPFRSTSHVRSASQPRPASSSGADDSSARPEPSVESSKRSVDDLQIRDEVGHVKDARGPAGPSASKQPSPTPTAGQKTHRLFGAHMNSIVTYQDAKTAWILTDDFLSRMSSNVYQRLVGGGYLGGIKLVRGYSEMNKPKDVKADATQKRGADGSTAAAAGEGDGLQRRERAAAAEAEAEAEGGGASPAGARSGGDRPSTPDVDALPRSKIRAIEREMSDLVSSANAPDPEQQEEEARKRDEKEIRDDYRDNAEDQGREIEHLVLVTHGIGQRLGLRMESVNFVHDVNVLRKTIKDVYGSSPDLQALNAEVDKTHKNSGIQVLPVCWRHLLDFPRQATRPNRAEHDLADAAALDDDDDDDDDGDEEQYPSLDDITVEGVPAVRNLVTDLALDILLYQSAYCEHISRIVQRECNRIYQLFVARNPGFKGHVSLVGHSLGSAILFDVLCRQSDSRSRRSAPASRQDRSDPAEKQKTTTTKGDIELDFDADAFVCLGSPIGLFQMLKGHTIAARRNTQRSDGLHGAAPSRRAFGAGGNPLTNIVGGDDADTQRLPVTVSSPKCAQLYNIFHPTDPIGYRIEPLISTAMSSLRPQPLPYTKKGIFGAPVGQGLSGIGARVGQSVSGLWTTLSSGIATSILNRSLGISGEDFTSRAGTQPPARLSGALVEPSMSMGAGTNISAGNVIATSTDVIKAAEARAQMEDKKRKLGDDISSSAASAAPGTAPLAAEGASAAGEHASTLMDTEIETLYAGFQKRRKSHQSDDGRDLGESAEWSALEERARKLRAEDRKVRALNANGRVDYSIQECVFLGFIFIIVLLVLFLLLLLLFPCFPCTLSPPSFLTYPYPFSTNHYLPYPTLPTLFFSLLLLLLPHQPPPLSLAIIISLPYSIHGVIPTEIHPQRNTHRSTPTEGHPY